MTVRTYRSTDASAPALSGNAAGQLIALLDACLVTGYGSQAGAGWTKPYTGTNLAAYKQGAGGSNCYLRVDDTMATAGRFARVVGYEAMTAVSTGTAAFPLDTQASGGLYWHTSASTPPAGNRRWTVVADERAVYLSIDGDYPSATNAFWLAFGDLVSYRASDAFCCALIGATSGTPGSSPTATLAAANSMSAANPGHYLARRHEQGGGSIAFGKHIDYVKSGQAASIGIGGAAAMGYPNGADGKLYMSRVWAHENPGSSPQLRGHFPGLWAPLHSLPFGPDDTFAGAGDLAGKTFIVMRCGANGQVAVETSDTWR